MSGVRAGAGFTPTDAQHWVTKAYVDARAQVPTFVQQAQPTATTAYVWYQTDASGNVLNVYVYTP